MDIQTINYELALNDLSNTRALIIKPYSLSEGAKDILCENVQTTLNNLLEGMESTSYLLYDTLTEHHKSLEREQNIALMLGCLAGITKGLIVASQILNGGTQ